MHPIREHREDMFMTQKNLADIMGVSTATISKWESWKQSVSDERILKLARVLKCPNLRQQMIDTVPDFVGYEDMV